MNIGTTILLTRRYISNYYLGKLHSIKTRVAAPEMFGLTCRVGAHNSRNSSQSRIFLAQISCTRHFFRSSANKEICDLKAIRRAVIFYLNFVINIPRTMTA